MTSFLKIEKLEEEVEEPEFFTLECEEEIENGLEKRRNGIQHENLMS